MNETLQMPPIDEVSENEPSLLDTELEEARNSKRGRITRKFGRMITGKDHPLQIVSGKEADLSEIKDAGYVTVEGSLDEARLQLDKVRNSRVHRLAKGTLRAVTGNKNYVTKKEAALSGIASELQQELAPRPTELEQAYALNTIHDARAEEVKLYQREEEARARDRSIKKDEELLESAGPVLTEGVIDPEILALDRAQQDAHTRQLVKEKEEIEKREGAAARIYDAAEQEQRKDEFHNPRPYRLHDNE